MNERGTVAERGLLGVSLHPLAADGRSLPIGGTATEVLTGPTARLWVRAL